MRLKIFILFLPLLFAACSTVGTRDGGGGILNHTEKVVSTNSDGSTTTTEKNTVVTLDQPANPEKGGSLVVKQDKNGNVTIGVDTSGTLNTEKDIAAINSLNPLIYIGAGLIIIGLLIGILGRQLLWAAGLGVTGIALITLAYLLPTYPFIFMIGLGVAILAAVGYIIYTARGFKIRDKAVNESIDLIDGLKERLPAEENKEIFKTKGGLADRSHSKSTRKLIDKKRLKNG